MQQILVRMGEMFLKGRNRPFFERQLLNTLIAAVQPYNGRVVKGDGRFYVDVQPDDFDAALQACARVFGVHSVSPAIVCDKTLQAVTQVAQGLLAEHAPGRFRVTARRADKKYPMTSNEFAAALGEQLLAQCPEWQVDLHDYQVNLQVELRQQAYVYTLVIPGAGGMPADTNGSALLMLSGGIDSPVAGYLTARRGVRVSAIYFHSFPYTSDHAKQKVLSLASQVGSYTNGMRVYVVPFTQIQEQIRQHCPDNYGTVLMRRYMMRLACLLAGQIGAQAVVTGESIGQVASQTMEGLVCSDDCADRPVLRPLVAMDKQDIMDIARRIGTYDTSILPYEDCCTVFTPAKPATHPKVERIRLAEQALDTPALLQQALAGCEVYEAWPTLTGPTAYCPPQETPAP